jgi:hypothetical protein
MKAEAIILCVADAVCQYRTNDLLKNVFERQMEEGCWTSLKTADFSRQTRMYTDAIINVLVTPDVASNLEIDLIPYLIVCHLISTSLPGVQDKVTVDLFNSHSSLIASLTLMWQAALSYEDKSICLFSRRYIVLSKLLWNPKIDWFD